MGVGPSPRGRGSMEESGRQVRFLGGQHKLLVVEASGTQEKPGFGFFVPEA